MPLLNFTAPYGARDRGTPLTRALTRGVCRMMGEMGLGTLVEFRLPNHRRVDVIGLGGDGEFTIVEIKSTVEDFRGDRKWREYLPFCERFYFAVPEGFPLDILPEECGVIVADRFGGAIRRPSPAGSVNGARKRRQLQRFAHAAATRLQNLNDPAV